MIPAPSPVDSSAPAAPRCSSRSRATSARSIVSWIARPSRRATQATPQPSWKKDGSWMPAKSSSREAVGVGRCLWFSRVMKVHRDGRGSMPAGRVGPLWQPGSGTARRPAKGYGNPDRAVGNRRQNPRSGFGHRDKHPLRKAGLPCEHGCRDGRADDAREANGSEPTRSTSAGRRRTPTRALFERVGESALAGERERLDGADARREGSASAPTPFAVDAVPRIIAAARLGPARGRPRAAGPGAERVPRRRLRRAADRRRRGRAGARDRDGRLVRAGDRRGWARRSSPSRRPRPRPRSRRRVPRARGQHAGAVGPRLPARRPRAASSRSPPAAGSSRGRSSRRVERARRRARGRRARAASSAADRVSLNDGPEAGAAFEHAELARTARHDGRRRSPSCVAAATGSCSATESSTSSTGGSTTSASPLRRRGRRRSASCSRRRFARGRSAASTRREAASPTTRRSTSTSRR